MIDVLLETTKTKASEDEVFKQALVDAYKSEKPIVNFCHVCNEAGIEIYPMDVADLDESFYAAMRRSTNGGGENSPHLGWEENVFEEFINSLQITMNNT